MKNIIVFTTLIMLAACGSKPGEQGTADDVRQTSIIRLTTGQYNAARITTGKIERRHMANHLVVNGKTDVPPQSIVAISAPLGGFVKSTDMLEGRKVRKGDVLAVLENQDYIQLQQDYLDNSSKLEFLEKEYTRQQELSNENVNSKKALELAKSQYKSMLAVVSGLEAKLRMVNVSTSQLRSGKIKSTILLYAPIDGFITEVNVNIGQFVASTDVLFRIVNLEHMHVEVQVYEKDVNRISIGQKVTFRLANDTTSYGASIYLVGKEISVDRTVRIHCHLEKEAKTLLPGMFVTAIIDAENELKNVVPTASVANYEGKEYIFVSLGDNQFRAIPVTSGAITGDFTQIDLLEKIDTGATIVTAGAFELMGLLKNNPE